MKNNLSIKNKVEAALTSIENIEQATLPPGFYTRLMAKINTSHTTIWEKVGALLLLPRVAFAAICFIVVINAVALYSGFSPNVSSPDLTELAISDEYSVVSASLYDLENEKP